jgi:Leucine-rich repeat (LRR) protein
LEDQSKTSNILVNNKDLHLSSNIVECPSCLIPLKEDEKIFCQTCLYGKSDFELSIIKEVKKNFQKVYYNSSLKQLSLSYAKNHISNINSNIFDLDIEALHINHTNLTNLPDEIGQLENLTFLSVFDNKLKDLPVSTKHLHKLETLLIGKNHLTNNSLKNISLLPNISKLDLSFNPFLTNLDLLKT